MLSLRVFVVLSVLLLSVNVSATVIPAQVRLPRGELAAGRSLAKPLVASPHNVPRTKTSRQLPFTFKDVRGVSSIQDRNGHLVCAVDPERTPSPGEKKKPLLQMCPFDSNDLEEQGLMFIGWHGNIRKNIDTLQEQVTDLPPFTNIPWYENGFFCFDDLKVARREALVKRRRCQFELRNNDNGDSCDEAMCGIFADKNWWLEDVGKAVFSRESLYEHRSKQGVLKYLDGYIHGGSQKLQDTPLAAFRYYYGTEKSMSLSIPEEYTSGLIAICVPDDIDQDFWETGFVENPRFKNGVDTVQKSFGNYYESMKNLRYHFEAVVGTKWNAYQF